MAQSIIFGIMECTDNVSGLHYVYVHFEVGFLVGMEQTFACWYGTQKFKESNVHEKWNLLNSVFLDPLAFFSLQNRFYAFFKNTADCLHAVVCNRSNSRFHVFKHRFRCVAVGESLRLKNRFHVVRSHGAFRPVASTVKRKIAGCFFRWAGAWKERQLLHLGICKNNRPFLGATLKRYLFELFEENS